MNELKKYSRVCAVFFSPCHNTEKAVVGLAKKIAEEMNCRVCEYDFTGYDSRTEEFVFGAEDIVVIGTPVYAGRIPNKVLPFVQSSIHGKQSPCVCVVTYGNRNFDDALGELGFLMKNNGMKVVGGAAIVSEHSFVPELASGHPDDKDMEQIREFAGELIRKIKSEDWSEPFFPGVIPPEKYYRPLKENGEPAVFLKAVPVTDESLCIHCGLCRRSCPMGVIDENPSVATGACIKCQACIKVCPVKARFFDNEDFLSHKEYLKINHYEKKESEFFI